jgi:hypothetical protein
LIQETGHLDSDIAQFGVPIARWESFATQSGEKQTSKIGAAVSAHDPTETEEEALCCDAQSISGQVRGRSQFHRCPRATLRWKSLLIAAASAGSALTATSS